MEMPFTRELGHANGDRPTGRFSRASATNGNGLSRGLLEASARTKGLISLPSERTKSHSAGLILLDAFLRPLNADEEAVSILSYPEIPRRNKRFDNLLMRRIEDRKSTRLNSSHRCISYAVFCLKKKNQNSNIYITC